MSRFGRLACAAGLTTQLFTGCGALDEAINSPLTVEEYEEGPHARHLRRCENSYNTSLGKCNIKAITAQTDDADNLTGCYLAVYDEEGNIIGNVRVDQYGGVISATGSVFPPGSDLRGWSFLGTNREQMVFQEPEQEGDMVVCDCYIDTGEVDGSSSSSSKEP